VKEVERVETTADRACRDPRSEGTRLTTDGAQVPALAAEGFDTAGSDLVPRPDGLLNLESPI
jgi:hypothetical protein